MKKALLRGASPGAAADADFRSRFAGRGRACRVAAVSCCTAVALLCCSSAAWSWGAAVVFAPASCRRRVYDAPRRSLAGG
ncbi:MAG: hypothetical protein ACLRMJ_00535 [Alistipes finegoldii]